MPPDLGRAVAGQSALELAGELKAILPELEKPLGQGGAGRFRLEMPKP